MRVLDTKVVSGTEYQLRKVSGGYEIATEDERAGTGHSFSNKRDAEEEWSKYGGNDPLSQMFGSYGGGHSGGGDDDSPAWMF